MKHHLPHTTDHLFLTDGGLETELVFHDGLDLPAFASFPLLDTAEGCDRLARYYREYLDTAAAAGLGVVLEAPTWRANADWGAELGYDRSALRDVNLRAIALLHELREAWTGEAPALVSGNLGPRSDGYVPTSTMTTTEAAGYHSLQVDTFAEAGADLVTAMTMTTVAEATGIAIAAARADVAVVLSFTVETDGRLVSGPSLAEAIEATDEATGGYPAYYMVNCAHPTHFRTELDAPGDWRNRIGGVRANASTLSHAELDECEVLDDGDPLDLAERYAELRSVLPSLRVVGGCCGTDHRHVAAIAARLAPAKVV